MKKWKLVALLFLVVIAGVFVYGYFKLTAPEIPAGAMNHFRAMATVEFCSMDPNDDPDISRTDYGLGEIDGFHIAGTASVAPKKLLNSLHAADRANNTTVAECFWPRHAIRDPNNHDNYLLICFKCLQVRWSFEGKTGLALITETPRDLFNATIDELKMDHYEGPAK